MNTRYVLKGKRAVPEADLMVWAKQFEQSEKRRVGYTEFPNGDTKVKVSTVFLGLDHNFGTGEPQLFETMVFGGPLDGQEARYATWGEAEKGHEAMCALVRDAK